MLRIIAFVMAFGLISSHDAQAQTNQRTQFNEGLAQFNELVMTRQIGDALVFLRPDIDLSDAERMELNTRLAEAYIEDFIGTDTVRSETLKGGFRQEMLAYWTDSGDYLYVYLLLHSRDKQRQVLNIQYDSDFHKIVGLF